MALTFAHKAAVRSGFVAGTRLNIPAGVVTGKGDEPGLDSGLGRPPEPDLCRRNGIGIFSAPELTIGASGCLLSGLEDRRLEDAL